MDSGWVEDWDGLGAKREGNSLLEALDKEVGADHGGALSLVKSLR